MAENGNGSLPENWGEMTADERYAYLQERRAPREAAPETPARQQRRRRNREAREAVEALEGSQERIYQDAPVIRLKEPGSEMPLEDLDDLAAKIKKMPHLPDRGLLVEMPVAEARQIDRVSLLMGLDPKVADKLSDKDIEEILAEERARAEAEDKQKALKEAREQIRAHMRAEKGLIDAATLRTREQNERLRSKVRIRFDLPGNGAGHQGRNGIRVDGRLYETKQWHTIPVAMLESFREMHYNVWVNEVQFTTLDQASRFGITTMNRLQGTTPAKAIFAQSPHLIEVQDAVE